MLCCIQMYGQDYVINLKHWDIKSGLIHRQVNCICKDRQGFMWVGTPLGLGRFDGQGFTWFTRERDSLPFNFINRISIDANGNLLVLGVQSEEKGIFFFDPISHKCIGSNHKAFFPDGTYFNICLN